MSLTTAVTAFSQRGARRGQVLGFLVYSAILTTALLALAAWMAPVFAADDLERLTLFHTPIPQPAWSTLGLANVFCGLILALAGFVVAPAMVATAVAQERRVGTLDQLRTTPLSPLQLSIGFIVGVPARLYLLCAGPLAVVVVAAVSGPEPLSLLAGTLGLIAVGTATSCALGLCFALAPRQESGGAMVALGVAAVLALLALTTGAMAGSCDTYRWAMWHPAGGISSLWQSAPTLWQRMAGWRYCPESPSTDLYSFVAMQSFVVTLALGVLLTRAACRKLAAPQLSFLSKPQAIGVYAVTLLVLLLPFVGHASRFDGDSAWLSTLFLMPLIAQLGLQATPTFEAWAIARRRGRRLGWYSDDAAPHGVMWLMMAVWAIVLESRVHWTWLSSLKTVSVGWAALVALSLPVYVLFAGTRYRSPAGRMAFIVAVSVHLVTQAIAVTVYQNDVHGQFMLTFIALAGLAGVVVPGWVLWRQHVMARSLIAE
ncbi:MAG TPA: hypothetical protein VIA18_17740 [Polyangia bacterium]|jgi:hypothetical protein|nr:hypothetical protein [Polyangia bacterium]